MEHYNPQTYIELEHFHLKEKHESIRMEVIENLVKRYPNDTDLGKEIRKFINLKK